MIKTGKSLMIGGVMALAVTATVAQSARRDGRWEVKVEMEMAGMTLPPQTAMQCGRLRCRENRVAGPRP